jgi:chromosome partitioning protein
MKIIAFLNNKGGVGKTSLVYHLAWKYSEMGEKVIAADLDPQANLTTMFLNEARLEEIWPEDYHPKSIYGAIQPLLEGTGDIATPHLEVISDSKIGLLAGDLQLSRVEDDLNSQWDKCLSGDPRAFRVISAFYRLIYQAAKKQEAKIILIDVGPNLGAINRAVLIAADFVITPMTPDIFSLQGLRNLGPTLSKWRAGWKERLKNKPASTHPNSILELPKGSMKPVGYIIQQHTIRSDRPVKAYDRWMKKIPQEYHRVVLEESNINEINYEDDSYCLATLKNYRSLMPMAQEARKPIFLLKPADGVIGGHVKAAEECGKDFKNLALKINEHCS